MATFYNHQEIEKKWQERWEKEGQNQAKFPDSRAKKYILDMFPYPSGFGLHVGHLEGYTATDIVSRYWRFKGFNVLHPIGWDSFGLPTENFAIKQGGKPQEITKDNIANFKRQIKAVGLSYDWSREVTTSAPDYYRWTQWLFLQLYKKGLAYKKEAPVNWCDSCKTVLANEQVVNGLCERCSNPVIQKNLNQWFFKITNYVEELLAKIDDLDWSDALKSTQKNWIGKSEGATIQFKIKNLKFKIDIFTTRPDTLCGATYLVLAPEHQLIQDSKFKIENYSEVEKYVVEAKHKNNLERTDLNKDKTGVELKGIKAINPATNEEIPIFVADYVVTGYGTGAIMAVPAHDERDFAFAKKFDLPIREVIMPVRVDLKNPPQNGKKTVARKTIHALIRNPKTGLVLGLKWKEQPWTGFVVGGVDEGEDIVAAARREVLEETGYKNLRLIKVLGGTVRGEYFAAHKDENRIAYVNAILFELENEERTVVSADEQAKHEPVWLDLKTLNHDNFTCAELDLWLARVNNEIDSYSGDGILMNSGKFDGLTSAEAKDKIIEEVGGRKQTNYKIRDWLVSRQRYWGAPIPIIYCETCGEVAVPEKDLPVLLPDDVDFRPTGESPLARSEDFKKVKCPKCGKPARREVDTMDTFVCSSWYFLRYVDANNDKAPFFKEAVDYFLPIDLYVGGMEHAVGHLLFSRFITKFLRDEGLLKIDEPFLKMRNQGIILASDSRKMSKRWGNVINPDDVIEAWGADSVRLYEMFMGPLEEHKPWQDQGILGVRRFLEKVYRLTSLIKDNTEEPDEKIEKLLQQLINKISIDIETLHFNTAIAAMMEFLNQANEKNLTVEQFNRFLMLLAPFAPHMAEEANEILGNKNSIFKNVWPEFNSALAKEDIAQIAIQINGKFRETISAAIDLSEAEVIKLALESENVKKYLVNGEYKKAIFVPNRLLNFIV